MTAGNVLCKARITKANLVHAVRLNAELAAKALGSVRLALVLFHFGHVIVSYCAL